VTRVYCQSLGLVYVIQSIQLIILIGLKVLVPPRFQYADMESQASCSALANWFTLVPNRLQMFRTWL